MIIPPHTTRHRRLSKKNRQLLAFVHKLMSTTDEMGQEWWDEFEKQLEADRLNFDRDQDITQGDL